MKRRTFLHSFLALLGMAWGRSHRLAALPAGGIPDSRWPLASPVTFPPDSLTEPWRPLPFDAWFELPAPGVESRELRLEGFLMRVADSAEPQAGLRAFCRLCPHEICWVDLRHETPELRRDEVPRLDHPVLVCPCHTSIFDPAREGSVIAGPAPRGLFQFGIETRPSEIAIVDVERDALAV